MGRLIPAGTGISRYRDFDAVVEDDSVDFAEDDGLGLTL